MDKFLLSVLASDRGKDDDEAGDEPAFGLYFPLEYVIDTWLAYRHHGVLPEPGAFNDQDPLLVQHDWGRLNARYAWLAAQSKEGDALDSLLASAKSDKDWMDLA